MPSSITNKTLPLAVSLGEPSGIGPEVILKSWLNRHQANLPIFFVIGRLEIIKKTAQKLQLDIPVTSISHPHEALSVFQEYLPVLEIEGEDDFEFGSPSPKTASLVLGAIKTAVDLIIQSKAAGLVTAPIHKAILYEAGFTCPGHTEYLAELCHENTGNHIAPVMMLASDYLRVVPLTIHIPLEKVPTAITADLIQSTCHKIFHSLKMDFGIPAPRIAVAGLNPHAGEEGGMGLEEKNIIAPALENLQKLGMDIQGPLPADTMFHQSARNQYDAALCMYHDQALIPIKTLDFEGGVNVTLGLPIVRSSPDHGTALNIAGQNMAQETSMINALKLAYKIHQNRQKWAENHV